MNAQTIPAPLRTVRRLISVYLLIGVGALGAVVVLRHHKAEVNSAVWTRSVIVVVTALLLLTFATRAAQGSRGAYRRLRIISIITAVALGVIAALPGSTFPLWMRIEQGVACVVMLAAAVLANGRPTRALFAAA